MKFKSGFSLLLAVLIFGLSLRYVVTSPTNNNHTQHSREISCENHNVLLSWNVNSEVKTSNVKIRATCSNDNSKPFGELIDRSVYALTTRTPVSFVVTCDDQSEAKGSVKYEGAFFGFQKRCTEDDSCRYLFKVQDSTRSVASELDWTPFD